MTRTELMNLTMDELYTAAQAAGMGPGDWYTQQVAETADGADRE
jgi:hypothetical protein